MASPLIYTLFVLGTLVLPSRVQCERPTASDGSSYCVWRGFLGRMFGQYQWQTCVSPAYLSTASNGTRTCAARQGLCVYKCQDELLDIHKTLLDRADATEACKCDPNAVSANATALPAKCFTPTGLDCTWHDQCIHSKFHCDWANMKWSKIGSKMCQLFQTHKNDFDLIGQRWISGVGKCLQISQVPLLRPYVQPVCEVLNVVMPQIHSRCYKTPGGGAPNLCDAGFANWMKVVGTVKQTLLDMQKAQPKESMPEEDGFDGRISKEGITLIEECSWDMSQFRILKMRLKVLDIMSKISSLSKKFADQLKKQLEARFGLGLDDLLIFPFDSVGHTVTNRDTEAYKTNVLFLIVSKQLYDLDDTDSTASPRMAAIFEFLEQSIADGTLQIATDDVDVTQVEICESMECGRPWKHREIPRAKLTDGQIALLVIMFLIVLCCVFSTMFYCMRKRNGLYKEKYIQLK